MLRLRDQQETTFDTHIRPSRSIRLCPLCAARKHSTGTGSDRGVESPSDKPLTAATALGVCACVRVRAPRPLPVR